MRRLHKLVALFMAALAACSRDAGTGAGEPPRDRAAPSQRPQGEPSPSSSGAAAAPAAASASASVSATSTTTSAAAAPGADLLGSWRSEESYEELGVTTFEEWEITPGEKENEGSYVIRYDGNVRGVGPPRFISSRKGRWTSKKDELSLLGNQYNATIVYSLTDVTKDTMVVRNRTGFAMRLRRKPAPEP